MLIWLQLGLKKNSANNMFCNIYFYYCALPYRKALLFTFQNFLYFAKDQLHSLTETITLNIQISFIKKDNLILYETDERQI